MTLDEIKAAIDEIKRVSGDDETAHSLEDELFTNFIQYVAKVASPELQVMAAAVLETTDIKFQRWCA